VGASHTPPVVEVEREVVEQVLERCRSLMAPADLEVLQGLFATVTLLVDLLRKSNTTIGRLRRLFGLSGREKSCDVLPPQAPAPPAGAPGAPPASDPVPAGAPVEATCGAETVPPAPAAPSTPAPPGPAAAPPKPKRKGHGRISAADYRAARHIPVPHATLRVGDRCPKCEDGKLYRLKEPVPILRIVGNAPLAAECWDCECFRCANCGIIHTARAPAEAYGEKHDETAASMIAILHYAGGMPFNRLDHLQRDLETPVPSSTQWDVVQARAELVRPAYDELVKVAAQGNVVHNDDSYAPILSLMGKRRAALLAQGKLPDPERSGLFTTAIVAIVAAIGAIVLFVTGRKHAGENLANVLHNRPAGMAPPIHMGDALTRNLPKGHAVVPSNCIVHGRRQIVDEIDNYPAECRFVIERLARVYKVDNGCKERGASDQERLLAHQEASAAAMEEARVYMAAQLEDKRIEPNSDLGKAFTYFLSRWDRFTLFLRMPGAPLDNNICERALKMAIRHRNASLFYRSERGAEVGDIYMTLIYTAELHGQNPYHYLTELQRNYKAVAKMPGDWLPWTYKTTLDRMAARNASAAAPRRAA
jgi:hypothetical protein